MTGISPIAEYLATLNAALRLSSKIRNRVLAEVGDHLFEHAVEAQRRGLDQASAEREACEALGRPVDLAASFGTDLGSRLGQVLARGRAGIGAWRLRHPGLASAVPVGLFLAAALPIAVVVAPPASYGFLVAMVGLVLTITGVDAAYRRHGGAPPLTRWYVEVWTGGGWRSRVALRWPLLFIPLWFLPAEGGRFIPLWGSFAAFFVLIELGAAALRRTDRWASRHPFHVATLGVLPSSAAVAVAMLATGTPWVTAMVFALVFSCLSGVAMTRTRSHRRPLTNS